MPRPTNPQNTTISSTKTSKKRPAETQASLKSKRAHLEDDDANGKKKRGRPVTAPVKDEEDESEDDEEAGGDLDLVLAEGPEDQDEAGRGEEKESFRMKDPNASRESHRAQKELQAQRRAAKPHSELLTTAKKHWTLLTQKTKARSKNGTTKSRDSEQLSAARKRELDALMGVLRGNVKDVAMKHDASRIVQSVVKWGGKKEREEIAKELVGSYKTLVAERYSKFLVGKIIRLCPSYRATILREFQGNVLRLLLHREASSVLADAFELHANSYERMLLVREFYGPEASLIIRSNAGGKDGDEKERERAVLGLKGVLEGQEEDRRKRVLSGVKESLTTILNNSDKGAVTHAIVHRVLLEYLRAISEIEDTAEKERLWREIFESCQDVLAEMVHTKDGSRAVREFLARGTAKDRKQILKTLKPHIERMCTDEEAQLVIFTALDVIDDTKLLAKSLIDLITTHTSKLYPSPHGRRALLYLLVPRTRRHFTPAQIAILAETDSIRGETSKKEPLVRVEEVRRAASAALIEFVEEQGDKAVVEPAGSLLVGEIMLFAEGDKSGATSKLLGALSIPYPSTDLSLPHPMDLPHTSRMFKTLLQGGHFSHTKKSIELVKEFSAISFANALLDTVGEDGIVGMAKGDGAFAVAELCERIREEGQDEARRKLRDWFGEDVRTEISQGDAKGKKVLLDKLALL